MPACLWAPRRHSAAGCLCPGIRGSSSAANASSRPASQQGFSRYSPSVGRSKGVLFTATRRFTEDRFGKDAVEACLCELDPHDQAILRDIEPIGWYPLEPVVHYMRALDRRFGKGDLGLCDEIGRYSAAWSLSSLHKLMLRFAPGEWLWVRGMRVWRQYHDTGRWESEKTGDRSMI